jgi:hypothetical protein
MSTNAYMLHLVDVACESPSDIDPLQEPHIADPATFIAEFLHFLATADTPITRSGTERAADILFTHPDVTVFFRDADAIATLRSTILTEILPTARQIFRDHWNYIIGLAFDEHVAVAALTHQ